MNIIRRILLVEDDLDDQNFFCEALQMIHPKIYCVVANEGVQAIKLLDDMLPFDLIFLDLNMPKMNGFECLECIKGLEVHKHIPVVIMSTSKHINDIEKCKQLGATAYFSKPSKFNELFNEIEKIISDLKNPYPSTFIHPA